MNERQKTKIVYKMQYAIKMRLKGHKAITTLPNPVDSRYQCWIFEDDQTFDSDLHDIIEEGRKSR